MVFTPIALPAGWPLSVTVLISFAGMTTVAVVFAGMTTCSGKDVSFPTPLAYDFSVDGVVAGLGPCQITNHRRLDEDSLEARLAAIGANSPLNPGRTKHRCSPTSGD